MAYAAVNQGGKGPKAARGLIERHVALPEAMRRLRRVCEMSERQAYRYLEAASPTT